MKPWEWHHMDQKENMFHITYPNVSFMFLTLHFNILLYVRYGTNRPCCGIFRSQVCKVAVDQAETDFIYAVYPILPVRVPQWFFGIEWYNIMYDDETDWNSHTLAPIFWIVQENSHLERWTPIVHKSVSTGVFSCFAKVHNHFFYVHVMIYFQLTMNASPNYSMFMWWSTFRLRCIHGFKHEYNKNLFRKPHSDN